VSDTDQPDPPTFEAVQRTFQEEVYRFFMDRFADDRDQAEDATVETFVAAYKAWASYTGPFDKVSLQAWLTQIAEQT
jgi:DNA-directed RNA polymerase specialized sigma24 family protein